MTDYTIAAIPTTYRGRRYRSRLEARWAAFFDLLGWRHEYEPFDLGSWSPDFGFPLSDNWTPAQWLLTEIKPFAPFSGPPPYSAIDKMLSATRERGILDKSHLLLLGTNPIIDPRDDKFACIGILGWQLNSRNPADMVWNGARIGWFSDPNEPRMIADIVAHEMLEMSDPAYAFGSLYGIVMEQGDIMPYRDHTLLLWDRACNAVQWRGGEARP
jgi:hypothetical protein